jgi:hypothetical protein
MAVSAKAQLVLSSGTYTQNFDNIGTTQPTGWTVTTAASSSSLGTAATFPSATSTWADTGGAFKNLASATGLVSTDTTTTQNASLDRSLGIRQIAAFGDAGAAFNFNFATTGLSVSSISLSLDMLSVQTRSTTWSIQYGVGSSPTSFTTLGTWSDPGAFGTTSYTFTTADFGSNLNNLSNAWFRVVALTVSSGSGSRDTIGVDDFSISTSAVPEPSTYAVLSFGLAGLAYLRRRTHK